MGLFTLGMGLVRSATTPSYSDGTDPLVGINSRGDLSTVAGMAPMAEAVRLGQTWQCSIATGSAFTHVAAWPTTRAELVLWNGESAGGKSYVIEAVWAANVATSIAAASAYTILAQIVPTSATAITDDTAQLITSRSGKSNGYQGKAKRAVANTAYAIASKWEVLQSSVTPAASIGSATFADVKGGLIVPPQAYLCLNLVTGTATGAASIGVTWSEMQVALG